MSKALMTIHGFLTSTKDFGRLYDYLDFYDEIKAVEVPGHNADTPDFSLFQVDVTFKTLLDAYDDLRSRHDQVDVAGFSMGGALTTWLCSVKDVHRAVLLAPANKYINLLMPFDAGKFYGGFGLKTYREADGKLSNKLGATEYAYTPYRENMATTAKIFWERFLRNLTPHTYNVFSKLVKKSDVVVETMSPITTPTLIMWGKLDELVPYSSVKFVLKHFSNIQEKIYPDVGHVLLYTNRDHLMIADIVEFLSEGTVKKEVPPRE